MTPATAIVGGKTATSRIDEVVKSHAARSPQAICMSFRGRHWTYGDCDALAGDIAGQLRRAGLASGDRIGVLCTPRPEYLVLLMAISRAGGVFVGLNPRHTSAEIAHAVGLTMPRAVFSLSAFDGIRFESVLSQAAQLTRMPPTAFFEDTQSCVAAVAGLPALAAPVAPPDDATSRMLDRTAAIVFTSGTTGRPKAAMLTHTGLLLAANVQHARLNPAVPRYLNNLPINHVGGMMNLTLASLVGGGSVVFQERFSPAETLRLLREESINCWLQVPAMFHECVHHADYDPAALAHLHSICAGGGALSAASIAKLRTIGARLFVEYGQTETSSSASYSDAHAPDEVLVNTIGRFDPRFEFRIADADGQPCATGVVGEIQGRGDLLFAGYFGDPEATREAFTADGWLRTGDLASLRRDGNVVLHGRLKEMIKSGGYNVYPREVELVLESHPAVLQVVVHGAADPQYGEAVHAVVRLGDPSVTCEAMKDFCRTSLANYKVPKVFRVTDTFPSLPNGKIDRVRTREAAEHLPPLQ